MYPVVERMAIMILFRLHDMLVQYVLTFKMFLEGGAGQGILFLLFLFQIFCLKILLKHFQYSQVTQSKSAQ